MLRQGIRRCAILAGAASPSIVRSYAATPAVRRTAALALQTSVTYRSIARASRYYSSEATATESENAQNAAAVSMEGQAASEPGDSGHAATGELAKFADLARLGVSRNLLDVIIKDMKYENMTPVQAKTITPALKGTDIVAQAKTGTGKTIAFLLPLLQRMIQEDPSLASRKTARNARSDDIRGIVLSPTRELAEQIAEEARRLTRHTGLVVQSAVGGTRRDAMLRQTQRQGCHLLVATPGRLCDLLQDSSSGIDAPNLAAMVLDEADRMLDVGFEQELADINRCLPSSSEKTRQTMLVSATIPNEVIRLARNLVRADDFEFVQTIPEHESLTHDHVPQHLVPLASWNNVFPALFELIDREIVKSLEDRELSPFKAIVYFNTTALVELASELGYQRRRIGGLKTPTFAIQSKLSQNSRSKAAEMFRRARSAVLFSSDVTARGMDFPDVTHVIQIDNPRDYESYIHRLGRTARQNKKRRRLALCPTNGNACCQETVSQSSPKARPNLEDPRR